MFNISLFCYILFSRGHDGSKQARNQIYLRKHRSKYHVMEYNIQYSTRNTIHYKLYVMQLINEHYSNRLKTTYMFIIVSKNTKTKNNMT